MDIASGVSHVLAGLLILGAAIWIGGFVAIMLVSASSKKAISPAQRVALFREIGRRFVVVAAVALLFVVVPGGLLFASRPWDGLSLATVLVVALLVAVTAVGVVQARRMTRMRRAALAEPDAERAALQRGTRVASALRASIGVCSFALFILAVAMM